MSRDPYNHDYRQTEIGTKGAFVGQCRKLFNILQQWDGKQWLTVPDVVDRRPQRPSRIHFDVEDALHPDDFDAN